MLAAQVVAAVAAVVWLGLALGHGRSWRTSVRLPPAGADPVRWPSVVAVVPARDEAAVLPLTVPTLVGQRYPGPWRVVVVDDDSSDGTGALAAGLGADVVAGAGPPPGWAGKVAAMQAGVSAAGHPDYLLFTDADIAHAPHLARDLVRAATTHGLDLTSQMARLRVVTGWERLVVPAFVYFFAQLYPFALVNRGRIAAAAGGCMLVRREALEAAGGLVRIRDAVIDDVALGRLLGARGPIWLGLAGGVASVREYPRLSDLWDMVARSADTQLRHSLTLLGGTVVGLLLVYVVPPVALVAGLAAGDVPLAALGGGTWAVMTATYVPMLRYHRLGAWRAVTLSFVAVLYAAMTVDSARRHRRGGARWKGRSTRG